MTTAAQIVGDRIMAGDPGGVSELAHRMRWLATEVGSLNSRFTGHAEQLWSGEAARAFAIAIREIPDDLSKISASFLTAGDALRRWADELAEVQDAARRLAYRATDAEDRRNRACSEQAYHQGTLKNAKAAKAAATDPASHAHADRRIAAAHSSLTVAGRRLHEADGDLRTVRREAHAAVEQFEAEARGCREALSSASVQGIRNSPWSWFERRKDIPVLGDIFVQPFVSLVELIKDPSVATWREFLSDVGSILAVAAVALIVIGTGGVALAAVAAAGVIASGLVVALDAVRVSRGEVDPQILLWDAAGLALSLLGAGSVAKEGGQAVLLAAGAASRTWATRYLKYGPSGQRSPAAPRLIDEAREEAIDMLFERGEDRYVPPVPGAPCGASAGGLVASPLALIRHTRRIALRREALVAA